MTAKAIRLIKHLGDQQPRRWRSIAIAQNRLLKLWLTGVTISQRRTGWGAEFLPHLDSSSFSPNQIAGGI